MSKPEIYGGNVNQAGHLKRYVRRAKVAPAVERIAASTKLPPEP